MTELQRYLPQAEAAAEVIDSLMLDELHLAAPAGYVLSAREGRVYLVGVYDPLAMGRSLRVYEHPEVARRLRMALGRPVTVTRKSGTKYVVLLHGKIELPARVEFPGPASGGQPDLFRLGLGLKGEVSIPAERMLNVMIGASMGSGKSSLLNLFVVQMQAWGWKLYLADPQSHTFNPDLWNRRAAMSVAGSQADLLKVLDAIEGELANRQVLFQKALASCHRMPNDIEDFNNLAVIHRMDKLPRLALVGDEFNYFLDNKAIFARLTELLRAGRKWGLHIVIAAHEWHKDSVPAQVNDLLQTRIALHSLSGSIVLRDTRWGRWVEGKPPGRGVLKISGRYEVVQFYVVPAGVESGKWNPASAGEQALIPEREAELVRRSLAEADGKMTTILLMGWGLSQREARDMAERYEARGWLAKDPLRDNARCLTDEFLASLGESRTNAQTAQTAQTFLRDAQTGAQTAQTGAQTAQTAGTS